MGTAGVLSSLAHLLGWQRESAPAKRDAARERLRDGAAPGTPAAIALERTWTDKAGVIGFLSANGHKTIGLRFVVTALAFFAAAGVMGGLMRHQLATANSRLLGPDFYNQLFSMHGTTMMFLFAVPVMQGFALYVVPLMIGTRNTAFPRMTACAYWLYLLGGLLLFGAFLTNTGPDAGWFAYVPLAGPQYGIGKRADVWNMLVTYSEAMGLMLAVDITTTIFKLRAPGMTLRQMPLFVWASLVTSVMIIFAMPMVMLAANLVQFDRMLGTHFFNPAEGGDALLWQHLFWFFGHPEVYFIFIPALGFISAIIPTFARRPMLGHDAIVLALIATGFLSFGLWVHHMFATNLPELGKSFFTAMSFMIAIPTALQIFCWMATIAAGRLVMRTPFLFVLGFFFVLLVGGLTGIMLGSVPLDLQVHDTYFVVAHLHYVLIGGAVFPLFGAIYYWYPKFTGRLMSERLGLWNFWLFFVGFNVAFFPMHLLGLHGMPRRVYTYGAEMGWGTLNALSTLGALMIAASVLCFMFNVWHSRRHGVVAGPNPWGGGTLEWATASPPAACNFEAIPVVHGRDPVWEGGGEPTHVAGLSVESREALMTTVLDAHPDKREAFPNPTPWPFVSALATAIFFIGSIFTPWAVVWGTIPIGIATTIWFWPRRRETAAHLALEHAP